MLDASLIEEILKRSDIVDVISSYINVTKKGRNYVAICPFHDDKNPSMMISKEKQIFKCFVCGTGGNAITFIQKYENISFDNAVRKLAEIIGFSDERLSAKNEEIKRDEVKEKYYKTLATLTKFYQISLQAKEGEAGLNYLTTRHIDAETLKYFSIGYCPSNQFLSMQFMQANGYSLKDLEILGVAGHSNGQYIDKNAGRVIFPLQDSNGHYIGYSARRIVNSDDAKYVNSPETPVFQKGSVLYNYHNAYKTARLDNYCYVLEGFMDVIALHRAGIMSAVALMGTALTPTQIKLLKRLNVEIRLCLDSDNAGQMATLKAIELLDKANIKYRIVRRSTGPKDADEILEKYGKEKLVKWLNILIDKVQFALNYFQMNNKLETIDERKKFIVDFMPFLQNINDQLELEDYITNIAKITKFERNAITKVLEKYRPSSSNADVTFDISMRHTRKLHRLEMTERAFIYQMLNDQRAIDFFNKFDVQISDEIFEVLANYIVEYSKIHHQIDLNGIISYIAQSSDRMEQELIQELTEISMDKKYPPYSEKILQEYLEIIKTERKKKYEQFMFEKSQEGKSEEEKLKILLAYNKKKDEILNKKAGGKSDDKKED